MAPLPAEKVQLAGLFGYQLLRGPRWKDEYEDRTRRFLEEYDRKQKGELPPEEIGTQNTVLMSEPSWAATGPSPPL